MIEEQGVDMKMINVVFDEVYNDVDLLHVPSEIADNIELVVREFNDWLSDPKNQKPFLVPYVNKRMVLSVGTSEFLWWLNHVKIISGDKASIAKQHTLYVEGLPRADF